MRISPDTVSLFEECNNHIQLTADNGPSSYSGLRWNVTVEVFGVALFRWKGRLGNHTSNGTLNGFSFGQNPGQHRANGGRLQMPPFRCPPPIRPNRGLWLPGLISFQPLLGKRGVSSACSALWERGAASRENYPMAGRPDTRCLMVPRNVNRMRATRGCRRFQKLGSLKPSSAMAW